ncbi:UNVERIFIED_CONTAM: hypothetical protein HDU68_000116 [Siphonaria sp. JEL0065]|nr:hypothetical protein HDU68_000116 [Siphonaria sp. JEL0065]
MLRDIKNGKGGHGVPLNYQALLFGELLASDVYVFLVSEEEDDEEDEEEKSLSAASSDSNEQADDWEDDESAELMTRTYQYETEDSIMIQLQKYFKRFGTIKALELFKRVHTFSSHEASARCERERICGWRPSPLCVACAKGHIEIVRILLAVAAWLSCAFFFQTGALIRPLKTTTTRSPPPPKNGHAAVMLCLLEHKRVRKTIEIDPDYLFISAVSNGHVDVVRWILKATNLNPAANNNNAIRVAAGNGHADVVKLLLLNRKVNPAVMDNYPIRASAANGHANVVKLLLKSPKVDPLVEDCCALKVAAHSGHADVVELLMAHSSMDSEERNFDIMEAVADALREGQYDVVRVFVATGRVEISDHDLVTAEMMRIARLRFEQMASFAGFPMF